MVHKFPSWSHVNCFCQTCLSTCSLMAWPSVRSSNPHFSGISIKSIRPGIPNTGPTSEERCAPGGNTDLQALHCNTRLRHCNLEAQRTQGSQITCKIHSDNVPLTALCLGSCWCSKSWPFVQNSYVAKPISENRTWTWAFEPVCRNSDCKSRIVCIPYVALIQKWQPRHPGQL